MSEIFQYSVLRYVHSQFSEEQLNIGLVFYFPNRSKWIFKSIKNLKKFHQYYKDFPEGSIKEYLQAFEKEVMQIENKSVVVDFYKTIETHFFTRESAPLQFSLPKTAVMYTDHYQLIVEQYFSLYFHELTSEIGKYEFLKTTRPFSEKLIIKNLREEIKNRSTRAVQYLEKSHEIKQDNVVFKPDFFWRNGTLNAVKAISFDLSSAESITDKALLFNNKLNYLAQTASRDKIRFDLIVAGPRNEGLDDSYKNALGILSEIRTSKKIVTEDEIRQYSTDTVNQLHNGGLIG